MLPIAKNNSDIGLEPKMLNRHGLITGATGTGKTVTLKVMAEQLSKAGIPVFLSDIKGDLASLSESGVMDENILSRLEKLNITDYKNRSFPVRMWDVFGTEGTPVRATVSEMGPVLISRMLGLNDTQTGILNIVFKIADDNGYLLLDLKDLQAMLQEIGENSSQYTTKYGNITKQSVGAIQRSLLVLEQQGGADFFGEPSIKLADFMQLDQSVNGIINILMAKQLFSSPLLYSTFLIWLLSELFEELPECGDLDKPKLVFFFDEAHLLFKDAPKAFVEQVEQVVRLIRSKGIGVFFITQNPIDIPENILGQLGNRVQHALRAYTTKEIKAVKAAADTFRQNPDIDTVSAITELKVGEALISFLDQDGRPNIVQRAFVRPPESKMGAVDAAFIPNLILQNPFDKEYREPLDRVSAYEALAEKVSKEQKEAELLEQSKLLEKQKSDLEKQKAKTEKEKASQRKKSPINKATSTFIDSMIRTAGREIGRSLLGILKK